MLKVQEVLFKTKLYYGGTIFRNLTAHTLQERTVFIHRHFTSTKLLDSLHGKQIYYSGTILFSSVSSNPKQELNAGEHLALQIGGIFSRFG